MGDEEPLEMKRRQMLRRSKIIIRKCKKSESASKTIEECKKVNGELSTENKGKEDTNDSLEIKVVKQNTPAPKKVVTIRNTRKRKISESTNDNDIVILDDDASSIIEGKKSNGKDGKHDSASVEFKGFKKRILAQTEKLKDEIVNDNKQGKVDSELDHTPAAEKGDPRSKVKVSKSKKKTISGKEGNDGDSDENQGESQTEYAQYLGLQPTMQFKCYRCAERGFPSMLALNMHQRGCGVQKDNFIANLQQDTSSFAPSDPNMLTNFRITRKVYLCSACGTYYENWNLFLHMRDVHKKHICLFCLTMFGTAEKLADHLKSIHNVLETTFKSSEEFQNSYKGSCYLICCICENMFSEREDYFHHHCEKRDPTAKCNLCGVKCGHYYTCPNSNSQRNVSAITKTTINKSKASEEIWMGKKGQGDMYDISDAASFCHVAIADESVETEKNVSDRNLIDLTAVSNEVSNVNTPVNKKPQSNDFSENIGDKNIKESDDQREHIENEPGSIHESDFPEKSQIEVKLVEEQDTLQKANESLEERPIELIEIDCENKTTDKNDTTNECDDIGEINKQNNSTNQNIDELQEMSSNRKETLSEHVCSEGKEEVEARVQESEEVKVDDKLHPDENIEKDETNVASSDSDGEPDTHSKSQVESQSSSDESIEEEECKKIDKISTGTKNEDPLYENSIKSDSDKPDNDVNNDDLNKDTEDIEKDNSREKESALDTKSVESSETSKDFHLDDVSSIEKDLDDEKEKENELVDALAEDVPNSSSPVVSDGIPLAGEDVPAMALTLEDKLEEASAQSVVKECVRTSCLNCVYCSHAIKIAVNGKQLALHLLAEHRYKPVKNNETSQDVVKKLKTSLNELESLFFNTDSYDSSDKSLNASYDYTYECFQCRFVTTVHKELYVHKRKMHQKTVLLCVMCKSNFYSYSELLCHMCPGIYVSEDIYFRCCFCNLDMIPSAFRLMVHLRKGHHTCDICLEITGDQQKLSTHMWKHKLNHLCYRCGIAYRNKPDITKHLFWKHGTESVLCKKCLQKKWPHVYHFCIPPTVFICEECDASFTKAVALKVHKRLHSGEFPYECHKCNQKFVSRKLLSKHEDSHNQPPLSENIVSKNDSDNKQSECTDEHINVESIDEPSIEDTKEDKKDNSLELSAENNDKTEVTPKSKKRKKRDKDSKPVLDVYDLPPLNLSSESDSSDEETNHTSETLKEKQESDSIPPLFTEGNSDNLESQIKSTTPEETVEPSEENQTPAPIVDGVWDNFHSYKAELEKRESKDLSLPNILPSTSTEIKLQPETPPEIEFPKSFLLDHSYCLIPGKSKPTENEHEVKTSESKTVEEIPAEEPQETPAPRGHSSSIDHPYATMNSSSTEGAVASALPPDQKPTTPPPLDAPIAETHSSSKKKQKTPKKKKHNANSSSSSDSSSDSDSTDCTCGTNCSCSNSSSSNSSSSSSSDSDSSTSEGKRRAAARKEKKKERLKHKHHKEEPPPTPVILPPAPPEEEPVVDVPVEQLELPIKESDLDTDESSTDEDFYDKYPQSHARQQLEKRNKLMLLASVAPVNNGTVSPPPPPPTPVIEENPVPQQPPPPAVKRKIKTKRRRKSQSKKAVIKTNLVHTEPSTSLNLPNATSTPSHMLSNHHSLAIKAASPLRTTISTLHSDATAGSGSENESARLSKRKRVRNKFYGYSSEEDENEKSNLKWRKVESAPVPQSLNFQPTLTIQRPQMSSIGQIKRPESSESSGTDEENIIKKDTYSNSSSSNSSESENEIDSKENVQKEQTEKSDNLYCYCQCPYDEVSEMIACDGQDCTIEWFHFECVGIMVPPKGKWYCPDCRKRRDLM